MSVISVLLSVEFGCWFRWWIIIITYVTLCDPLETGGMCGTTEVVVSTLARSPLVGDTGPPWYGRGCVRCCKHGPLPLDI